MAYPSCLETEPRAPASNFHISKNGYARARSALLVLLVVLSLPSCQREKRELRPEPSRIAVYGNAAKESTLSPGGPIVPQPVATNPSTGSGYEISEGQRLFDWYNCSGCHAHGGGGIGPPLIKQEWIYGGAPENIFDTIVKGRPNGMPSWGGRIPEYQVWQLVAYIRSINGQQPTSATPTRADTIEQSPQTLVNRTTGVTK